MPRADASGPHHGHPGRARGDPSPVRRPGRPGDVRPIRRLLRRKHTDVLSGREFLVGAIDVLLGDIDGCPFYIDKRLDQAWHQEQFLLDVAPGEPEDFSLAAGDNLHFVTRSPACVPRGAPGENVLSFTSERSTP